MTFQELAADYRRRHLISKPSKAYYERLWRQLFADWTEHKTRKELRAFRDSLADTPSHANKAIGFLKAMYKWGIKEEIWPHENPARDIERITTGKRTRVFTNHELSKLVTCMEFPESPAEQKLFNCLTLLLCTASRITEIRSAEWRHIDFEQGSLFKPNTKNGREQTIPLPRQALAAVRSQYAMKRPDDRYVFMGYYGHCWGLVSVEKSWGILRRKLGLNTITLHDFRRTVATKVYAHERDPLLVKAILNHYDPSPTAHYVFQDFDRIAKALQDNSDRFWGLRQSAIPDIRPSVSVPVQSPTTKEVSHDAPSARA